MPAPTCTNADLSYKITEYQSQNTVVQDAKCIGGNLQNIKGQNKIEMLSNQNILEGLGRLVKSERKLMHVILSYIHEIEVRKLHLEIGYDSIYKFLTVHHGYSEDAAYARMHASRLLAKVPEIQDKLEAGSISLTQISKVCSAIRAEQKAGTVVSPEATLDLFTKIENKNLLETRKTIAVELNQPVVEVQLVKPQKDDTYVIQTTLNKTQYDAFVKARSLISHSVSDNNIAEAIHFLSQVLIKKVEGTSANNVAEFCRRSKGRATEEQQNFNDLAALDESDRFRKSSTQSFRIIRKSRKYISVKVRREIFAEANHRCTFTHPDTGIDCNSSYQLQVDHIIPLSEGGSDNISNLRVLCGIHNRRRVEHSSSTQK